MWTLPAQKFSADVKEPKPITHFLLTFTFTHYHFRFHFHSLSLSLSHTFTFAFTHFHNDDHFHFHFHNDNLEEPYPSTSLTTINLEESYSHTSLPAAWGRQGLLMTLLLSYKSRLVTLLLSYPSVWWALHDPNAIIRPYELWPQIFH